jgi:hypothetical protein
MKPLVGVIAALVTLGMAALGLFAAQQLHFTRDHIAGPVSGDRGTSPPAAQTFGFHDSLRLPGRHSFRCVPRADVLSTPTDCV